jgi:hypothetical protein
MRQLIDSNVTTATVSKTNALFNGVTSFCILFGGF